MKVSIVEIFADSAGKHLAGMGVYRQATLLWSKWWPRLPSESVLATVSYDFVKRQELKQTCCCEKEM